LCQTLDDPTKNYAAGPPTRSQDGDEHVEDGAQEHGPDQEPLGAEVLAQLPGHDLRDQIPPEERRQDGVGAGPLGVRLKIRIRRRLAVPKGTYGNVGTRRVLLDHGDDPDRQSGPHPEEDDQSEGHEEEL
jgi:hypothetical protein